MKTQPIKITITVEKDGQGVTREHLYDDADAVAYSRLDGAINSMLDSLEEAKDV